MWKSLFPFVVAPFLFLFSNFEFRIVQSSFRYYRIQMENDYHLRHHAMFSGEFVFFHPAPFPASKRYLLSPFHPAHACPSSNSNHSCTDKRGCGRRCLPPLLRVRRLPRLGRGAPLCSPR